MSWTAFMAAIQPARLGPGKVFHASAVAVGPSPGAAPPGLVNRAADFSDGNDESDQSGNQQPGTTLDGHQDAGANDRSHANPNHKSINQFHQAHVSGPGPGFNSRFPASARGAHPDIATNVGIGGRTAGLRPGGSSAGPGNAAGPEAGAPVVVVSRSPRAPDRRSTRRQAGARQKKLASARRFPQHRRGHGAGWSRFDMKARIVITPKKAVVDPQGKAVQNALEHMGYGGINA